MADVRANAGQSYFIQISQDFGSPIPFGLKLAPAPLASFVPNPSDPSTLDSIDFPNDSYDPAYADLMSAWQFGDGTTSTEQFPTHQYVSEGDYTVQLTVTTLDGRTASVSAVV